MWNDGFFLRFFSTSHFCSRTLILLVYMCFGIRIMSPMHLATQIISMHNPNCPKNEKKHRTNMILGMLFQVEQSWVTPPPPVPCACPPPPVPCACLEQWQTRQALVATGWRHRSCDRRQHLLPGQAVWRQGDQQGGSLKLMSAHAFLHF